MLGEQLIGGKVLFILVSMFGIISLYFSFFNTKNISKLNKSSLKKGIKTPLEILKRKYDRGIITKEQYENLKKDLQEEKLLWM